MIKNNKYKISDIQNLKNSKNPFATVTVYDYPTSKIINDLNIPLVLVGDSASMVVYGYENTTRISVDELLLITKAVSRGADKPLIVADMPFMSYQPSNSAAVKNAGRFIKEGRADAVKLEGGTEYVDRVKNIIKSGIPVMGHIGLLPQSVLNESGYKIKGKTIGSAQKVFDDAIALEGAGVFSIVLEGVPKELAKIITKKVKIPTVGIGAGSNCDGQIQVFHDVVGMFGEKVPKHAKVFVNSKKNISDSIKQYVKSVNSGLFPNDKHSVSMSSEVLKSITKHFENN